MKDIYLQTLLTMPTDKYTKAVLTVIALCLITIVIRDLPLMPTVRANDPAMNHDLNVAYGIVPLNEDGSINVRMDQSQVVDVRLRGIDEASSLRWEAINVRVTN